MMNKEMPSQEEHDEVVWYVLKRPLTRPETSYGKAVIYILGFVGINIFMVFILCHLLERTGISFPFIISIKNFYNMHRTVFIFLLSVVQFTIGVAIVSKRAVIGAVHLYQRYAPEYIRRRCLFKPTCSEYTIMAIEKYGVIRGLQKAYIRLFKKCRGRIYMIDEP